MHVKIEANFDKKIMAEYLFNIVKYTSKHIAIGIMAYEYYLSISNLICKNIETDFYQIENRNKRDYADQPFFDACIKEPLREEFAYRNIFASCAKLALEMIGINELAASWIAAVGTSLYLASSEPAGKQFKSFNEHITYSSLKFFSNSMIPGCAAHIINNSLEWMIED